MPRVANSKQTVLHGLLTERWSNLVRTTLVHCTLMAKKHSAYLSQFYEWVKAKKGGGNGSLAAA